MLSIILPLLYPISASALDWEGKIQQNIRDLQSPNAHIRLEALTRLGRYPTKRSSKYILRALDDLDPQIQRKAASLAAEKKLKQAIPVLVRWLSNWDEKMRISAAKNLGLMGDSKAIKSLVRALVDPEPKVRLSVVKALGKLSSKTNQEIVPLLGRLNDTNSKVRRAVIEIIAIKKDRRAVIPLLARLNDPARDVRLVAVKALGEIGDKGAGPPLVRLIRDQAYDVATAAIETLGKLRYRPATEPLIDLLKSGDYNRRANAASALAAIRTKLAIRALVAGLLNPSLRTAVKGALVDLRTEAEGDLINLLRDPRIPRSVLIAVVEIAKAARLKGLVPHLIQQLHFNRIPKLRIIQALGKIADPRIQRPLLELLERSTDTLKTAILVALEHVIDERAAEPLLRILNHPNTKIHLMVIDYLGRLRAKIATPGLLRLTRGKSTYIVRAAASALAQCRDPRSIPGLIKLLQHKDRLVRRIASQALGRIHSPQSIKPLLQLCRQSNGSIQVSCIQALGGVLRGKTDEQSMAFFKQLVQTNDRSVFLATVDALAAMKDVHIAAILAQRFSALDLNRRRKVIDMMGNSIAYRSISIPLLHNALRHKAPSIRSTAAWALGKLQDQASIPHLIRVTRERNWMVRVNAAAALARMRSPKLSMVLKSLMADPVSYVRANAILGLAWNKSSAIKDLMPPKLLQDRSPWVRINTLRGLKRLGQRAIQIPNRPEIKSIKMLLKAMIAEDVDPRVREIAQNLLRPAARKEGNWIGLYLVDQQRRPLRNKPFILITPTGLVKVAFSDVRAEAWEENLVDGYCYTELPPPELSTLLSKN